MATEAAEFAGQGLPAEPSALIRRGTAHLTACGLASPRADAEQLAAHVLGVPRGRLAVASLDESAVERFEELIARRGRREPLQHLIGSAGFRAIELAVGPGVFVPRPETEVVVQAALDWLVPFAQRLHAGGEQRPLRVVDLCTGSGAIALSLAAELPTLGVRDADVHAVDLHADALRWMRDNARRLGLNVSVHEADAEHALAEFDGEVDCVVSNPPYVAEHELDDVDPEVRDHDPTTALIGGEDGLSVIRSVEQAAWRLLRPGGLVLVEHSDRQGRSAPALFADRWEQVRDHRDLAGRDRYLTAIRPPASS